MKDKSANRTMLMSLVMSAPGPIVVGLGLIAGKSSTQLADFLRRSAELLALVAAYICYKKTQGDVTEARKARLQQLSNRFVGAMMAVSGVILLLLALFLPSEEKGNVIPGLVIALLGVVANSIFCVRYTRMGRAAQDAILSVQGRLYGAKTLVDLCVSIALVTVALFPGSSAAAILDMGGSAAVAVYLLFCGIRTVREAR